MILALRFQTPNKSCPGVRHALGRARTHTHHPTNEFRKLRHKDDTHARTKHPNFYRARRKKLLPTNNNRACIITCTLYVCMLYACMDACPLVSTTREYEDTHKKQNRNKTTLKFLCVLIAVAVASKFIRSFMLSQTHARSSKVPIPPHDNTVFHNQPATAIAERRTICSLLSSLQAKSGATNHGSLVAGQT